jgi:hypothetical protein
VKTAGSKSICSFNFWSPLPNVLPSRFYQVTLPLAMHGVSCLFPYSLINRWSQCKPDRLEITHSHGLLTCVFLLKNEVEHKEGKVHGCYSVNCPNLLPFSIGILVYFLKIDLYMKILIKCMHLVLSQTRVRLVRSPWQLNMTEGTKTAEFMVETQWH